MENKNKKPHQIKSFIPKRKIKKGKTLQGIKFDDDIKHYF